MGRFEKVDNEGEIYQRHAADFFGTRRPNSFKSVFRTTLRFCASNTEKEQCSYNWRACFHATCMPVQRRKICEEGMEMNTEQQRKLGLKFNLKI